MKKLILILSLCIFVGGMVYAGKRDPVGVLFQVKGKVEYTKNGTKWKKVRRNKFLFDGYVIRTGPAGSGKVTMKESGKNTEIGPNSVVKVTKKGLKAQSGSLTASQSSGKLMSGLMKKFTKSQSYTTVRRSHKKSAIKLDAVREIALTDDHPYLVWDNLGSKYQYTLTLGDKTYNVPASKGDIVRVKVKPFAGEQDYKITALKNGNAVVALKPYKSRGQKKNHTAVWLNSSKKLEIQDSVRDIQETYGENSFMLGSFYEKQEMWVASMDQYKQYLQENPDEIEMTPYLFRVYKKLKLKDTYKRELEEWKKAMME
ncbi:MAG: hypothetical protein GY866_01780 [Proteobacteria bacterium]|nr:hypothetical protein [Pseudomonadota bacterium]